MAPTLTNDSDEVRLRSELGAQPLTLLKQFAKETDWDLVSDDKDVKLFCKTVEIDKKKRMAFKTEVVQNLAIDRMIKIFTPGILGSASWNSSIKKLDVIKEFPATTTTVQAGHDLGGGIISGRTMMVNQTHFSDEEGDWFPFCSCKGWEGADLPKGQVEMMVFPGSGSRIYPLAGDATKTHHTWIMICEPQLRFVPQAVLKRVLSSTFLTFMADLKGHILNPDGSF